MTVTAQTLLPRTSTKIYWSGHTGISTEDETRRPIPGRDDRSLH